MSAETVTKKTPGFYISEILLYIVILVLFVQFTWLVSMYCAELCPNIAVMLKTPDGVRFSLTFYLIFYVLSVFSAYALSTSIEKFFFSSYLKKHNFKNDDLIEMLKKQSIKLFLFSVIIFAIESYAGVMFTATIMGNDFMALFLSLFAVGFSLAVILFFIVILGVVKYFGLKKVNILEDVDNVQM